MGQIQWNKQFKAFLAAHDYTARKVSEETGIAVSTINSYLQGQRVPREDNKRLLKERIGFDIYKVLGGIE